MTKEAMSNGIRLGYVIDLTKEKVVTETKNEVYVNSNTKSIRVA